MSDDNGFKFVGQKKISGQMTMIRPSQSYASRSQIFNCQECKVIIQEPLTNPKTGASYLLCQNCYDELSPKRKGCCQDVAKRCGQEEKFEMTKEIYLCLICVIVSLACIVVGFSFLQSELTVSIVVFCIFGLCFSIGCLTCFKQYGVARTLWFACFWWICCEEEFEITTETEKIESDKYTETEIKEMREEQEKEEEIQRKKEERKAKKAQELKEEEARKKEEAELREQERKERQEEKKLRKIKAPKRQAPAPQAEGEENGEEDGDDSQGDDSLGDDSQGLDSQGDDSQANLVNGDNSQGNLVNSDNNHVADADEMV